VAVMEDEVVISEIEAKVSKFEFMNGEWTALCDNYDSEAFQLKQSITYKPQYLAVRIGNYIKKIIKIDQSKSDFDKGLIAPERVQKTYPNVLITLNVKEEEITGRIFYASFQTLLTHVSINEFTEEKSPKFKKVIVENRKILCNGYECNHICYCKYFNHAEVPVVRCN
jgi:hypothetical protein